MEPAPELREALVRGTLDDVVRAVDPDDPRLAGVLWEPGPLLALSFDPLLSSSASTPFVLDHERFGSIESFYHALKLPEASDARRQCALAAPHEAYRMTRRLRGGSFAWRGRTIEVGSRDHEALIAAAVEAKLAAHPAALDALRATGRAPLQVGRFRKPTTLGRAMTFALMVARLRDRRSPRSHQG